MKTVSLRPKLSRHTNKGNYRPASQMTIDSKFFNKILSN